jgi:hypothetical protein
MEQLGDVRAIAAGLDLLAGLAYRQGEREAAAAAWRRALTLFAQVKWPRRICGVLERLAQVAADRAEAQRGVTLLSASTSLRRRYGVPRPPEPSGPAELDLTVAGTREAARTTLTAPQFDAAWARGEPMSLDQAVAYALETLPEQAASSSSGR